ncbi:MAG: metallophosphoesterase [Anaerolineaceae bacterium]
MKFLSVSDVELGIIYNPHIAERFAGVDFVISCGDLPYYYLEYIVSSLDVPLYYVNGNHVTKVEITSGGERTYPWGATNIHGRTVRNSQGVIFAGIEGSLVYNYGPHQYSQSEMWMMVWLLTPKLFLNKMRYGKYVDIFVTHAAPWKIQDAEDRPHQGIKAFRWFDKVFKPKYHLHGHIHVYRNDTIIQSNYYNTIVLNTYGYKEIQF